MEASTLASLAGAAAYGAEKGAMPTRVLGKTGARVSMLAMGCGSRFFGIKDEGKCIAFVQRALDLGVTYFDTADDYDKGRSEVWLGKGLGTRRPGVFLATKVSNKDRSADGVMRAVEQSLKNLGTDHVDLLHIHALMDEDDMRKIEAKGGAIEGVMRAKAQKMARFIGVSCHNDPGILKQVIERHDFDCTQMALNAAMIGQTEKSQRGPAASFEAIAMPVARRKNMGVIAMKVFAQEKLNGKAPVEKLIAYPLSVQGVHVAVVGMPALEHLEQNVAAVKAYKPMGRDEMKGLSGELSTKYKAGIDRFMKDHIVASRISFLTTEAQRHGENQTSLLLCASVVKLSDF